jgi:hypothetical protein
MFKLSFCMLLSVLIAFSAASSSVVWPVVDNQSATFPAAPIQFDFPQEFNITANVTIRDDDGGCGQYSAVGQIVVTPHTTMCSVAEKIQQAINAGAVALMLETTEIRVGRYVRVRVVDSYVDFPVVFIGGVGSTLLHDLVKNSTFVTVNLIPTQSVWITEIFDAIWFFVVQALILAAYLGLLIFTLWKLISRIKAMGFTMNIGNVFLLIDLIYVIIVLVTWIDPFNSRALYDFAGRTFLGLFSISIAFPAALLMAFFWLETVRTYEGLKTTKFLNRCATPFYVIAGCIVALAVIAGILAAAYQDNTEFSAAIGIIQCVALLGVAVFYCVVAGLSVKLLNKMRDANARERKVYSVEKIRRSVIVSSVFLMLEAWCNFILTALGRASDYFYVASAIVSAVLLGVLVLVQVRYLGVKSNRSSSSGHTRKTTMPRVTSTTQMATAGQVYTQASSKQSDVDSKMDNEETKPTSTVSDSSSSSSSSSSEEQNE